jgi:hypothetical protein
MENQSNMTKIPYWIDGSMEYLSKFILWGKLTYIIAFVFCLFLGSLTSCNNHHGGLQQAYITNDSTISFLFVCDSLYIDTIGSYCNIPYYFKDKGIIGSYCIDDSVCGGNGEVVYIVRKSKHFDTTYIRISPDHMGNHWNYLIKFGDSNIINVSKVY